MTNNNYLKINHDKMKDLAWEELLGRKIQMPEKILYSGNNIQADPDPMWLESKRHVKGILKVAYTTYNADECEVGHLILQDGDTVYAYIANYYGDSFVVGIINTKSEKDEKED